MPQILSQQKICSVNIDKNSVAGNYFEVWKVVTAMEKLEKKDLGSDWFRFYKTR